MIYGYFWIDGLTKQHKVSKSQDVGLEGGLEKCTEEWIPVISRGDGQESQHWTRMNYIDFLLHGHQSVQGVACKCILNPSTWYLLLVTGHQVILPALQSFLLLKCIRNHSAATLGRQHMSIPWPCSGHATMPILHHGISHPVFVPLTHVTSSSNRLKLLFIQGVIYCRNLHAKCKTSLTSKLSRAAVIHASAANAWFWCIQFQYVTPSPSTWHQCSPPGRRRLHLHKPVPSRWVVCTPRHEASKLGTAKAFAKLPPGCKYLILYLCRMSNTSFGIQKKPSGLHFWFKMAGLFQEEPPQD